MNNWSWLPAPVVIAPRTPSMRRYLRQTVAMVRGSDLSEHENPGEATQLVLHGRVRMSAGELA